MASSYVPAVTADCVIDVSHWNGEIDFAAVVREGIRAVFVKATQGADGHDHMYRAHADGAAAAGLLTAPYHFITADDADDQIDNLDDAAQLEPGMLVMLDWERSPHAKDANADLVAELGRLVIEATGRAPLLYCGHWQLAAPHPVLSSFPLMLPEYGTHPICPPGWDAWLLHQYTEHGSVHGIHGFVDRSVFAGTVAALEAWWTAKPVASPMPVSAPDPVAEPEPVAAPVASDPEKTVSPSPPQKPSSAAVTVVADEPEEEVA